MEPEEEPGGAAAREVYEEVRGRLSWAFTGRASGALPGNRQLIVLSSAVVRSILFRLHFAEVCFLYVVNS